MPRAMIFLVLVGPILFLACQQGQEPLNNNDFNVISTADEIQMGDKFATQIEESLRLYSSASLQRYVDSIGQAIVRVNDRRDIPTWTFKVVDDPNTVNAFALPGGHIYVYTGLMRLLANEAELAAVVAHEVSHVSARHSAEQLSKAYAFDVITSFIIGDSSSVLDTLVANVLTTGVFLKYSRDAELEADSLGTWYEYQAGWDPQLGMLGTLGLLDSVYQASLINMPEFLSTHPDPSSRIEAVTGELTHYQPYTGQMLVNQARYRAMVGGL